MTKRSDIWKVVAEIYYYIYIIFWQVNIFWQLSSKITSRANKSTWLFDRNMLPLGGRNIHKCGKCLFISVSNPSLCVFCGQWPLRDPAESEGEEVYYAGWTTSVPCTNHQVETARRFHGGQLFWWHCLCVANGNRLEIVRCRHVLSFGSDGRLLERSIQKSFPSGVKKTKLPNPIAKTV